MLRLLTIAATAAALVSPVPAAADHNVLETYAADTWRSMAAMVHPETGLPSDNINGALDPASRSKFTSPTNVGMYLWATVGARHLGLISTREAKDRVTKTLATLGRLPRHTDSGQFYNWYDPATGEKLRVWPVDGSTVFPFLSSVD